MSERADLPVLVVGAGPTGAAVAIALGQRGVPVTVVDRHTDVYPQPRAVHLDDEVYRILGRLGVADAFGAISRPGGGLRLVDRRGRVLGEFGREGVSPANGRPRANMFDQPDLEHVLRARLKELPSVTLRGGAEVVHLGTAAPGRTDVRLRDVVSGAEEDVSARFVLGCDGARSVVRESIDSRLVDLGFEQRWLVVDVETSADLGQWDGVHQVCDSARAATFMRIGETRYRWELQLVGHESDEDFTTLDALRPLLSPWLGAQADGDADLRLVRVTSYTFRAAVADRWRADGVLLLGDAAHLTPPFIGQGLGSGVRDADNLAWKIAGVLDGSLAADVLDTYEQERRPHATGLVQLARQVGLSMTAGGRVGDAVRRGVVPALSLVPSIRRAVTDSTTPPLGASSLARRQGRGRGRDPLVGTLCPDVALGSSSLDDHLDGRWAVVSLDPLAPSDRDRVKRLGVVVLDALPAGLGAWLADAGRRVAVVRPDLSVMTSDADVPTALAAVLDVVAPTLASATDLG